MDNNYKFNRHYKAPDPNAIEKHKDFEQLMASYEAQQTPPKSAKIRNLWVGAAAIAAILAGLFVYFGTVGTSSSMTSDEYFAAQDYVNPPIQEALPAFASYTVDAYLGGTYEYKSGSKLVIPPRSFVNRSGNVIQGEVEIKYREYHDFVDFFMSGIPMNYDSAGVEYILESAGMVEIYAEQNGERIFMNPESSIDVELVSNINIPDPSNPPSYNIYKLDEEARNWVYNGKDQYEILAKPEDLSEILSSEEAISEAYEEEKAAIANNQKQELAKIEATIPKPAQPQRPQVANENNITFDFDFSDVQFQTGVSNEHDAIANTEAEMHQLQKQYEGTVWEIPASDEDLLEAISSVEWEYPTLRKIGIQDYEITLVKGEKRLNFNAKPVLMGDDYQKAIQAFDAQMATFEEQMASREAQLADQKAALQARIDLEQKAADERYEERLAIYQNNGRQDLATTETMKHKIVNRFRVSSMGIWNCDRPLPPFIYSLAGNFKDQFNTKYDSNTGFLVNKARNTVVKFHVSPKTRVQFDNRGENLMWIITEENKLAVYRPEDFKTIDEQEGKHTFVLDLIDQEINTEEDIRNILAL